MDIPIVIAAYNRPNSLRRILESISKASFSPPVKLYISIDGGGDDAVIQIANSFEWNHGTKEIILHENNIGLRNHILSCGDLAFKHDAVIVLEDDLFVSPLFYEYTVKAVEFYQNEKSIAGISLYAHRYNETAMLRFTPLADGNSVFFMQIASSWGQCWTKGQWSSFREWYNHQPNLENKDTDLLPPNVCMWPESSWKKYFIKYMIEKNLYFVYPQTSYSTNFGDMGTHHKGINNLQVSLCYGNHFFQMIAFEDSYVKYDSFCEILPHCLNHWAPHLSKYDYDVDLYGKKPLSFLNKQMILTTKSSAESILSFDRKMLPHELNIIAGIKGEVISLSNLQNIAFEANTIEFDKEIFYYHKLPQWYGDYVKAQRERQINGILDSYTFKTGKFILLPIQFILAQYRLIKAFLISFFRKTPSI